MGADYLINQAEQDAKEEQARYVMWEAAIYVVRNKLERYVAIQNARDLEYQREEARQLGQVSEYEKDGYVVETFFNPRLQYPSINGLNKKQIEAVYLELCASEGISPS